MATRCNVFLCKPENGIQGTKLPSKGQIVSLFLHLHDNEKKTVKESAAGVISRLVEFWTEARIPMIRKDHAVTKVEKLYSVYTSLKRGKDRRSTPQTQKEDDFTNDMKNLFDIASANALIVMTKEEDKQFLVAQREPGRRGTMGSADVKLAKKEKLYLKRKQVEECRIIQKKRRSELDPFSSLELESSSTSESENDDKKSRMTADSEMANTSKPQRATKTILTQPLSMALDRTKVTDRAANFILTETARSVGSDPKEFNINELLSNVSVESIERYSQKN